MTETFDYIESRDDADELITEFGQTIALRRSVASGTDYDPTLTPTDYATKAAKVDFTMRQLQSGNILATDERWLVAAGPLTALGIALVLPSDALVIGSEARQVVKADPINPGGTVVVYDCHVRV